MSKHSKTANPSIKLAHASELVILKRLLDFRAAVHHERTVTDNRLGDGFATHYKKPGVGLRFHGDAVTTSSEDGKVAFTGVSFAVHFDFTGQHEKRSCVAVR